MSNKAWLKASCDRCVGKPEQFFNSERLEKYGVIGVDLLGNTEAFRSFTRRLICKHCDQKDAVVFEVIHDHVRAELRSKEQGSQPQCMNGQSSKKAAPPEFKANVERPRKVSKKTATPPRHGADVERSRKSSKKTAAPPKHETDLERFRKASRKITAGPKYDEFGNIEPPEFGSRDDYKKDRKSWVNRRD